MSDATQEKRGRNVWGLSSSDTESCWGWRWLTSCTLGAHAWPRVLHRSGSAEPNQLLFYKRGLVPQSLTLVLMTPEAWRKELSWLFCGSGLLSLNAQSLWYNQWLFGEYFIFPNAFQTSEEPFSARVMTLVVYERGSSTCWRTWCSCLMQISPLWHDGSDKSFQPNWSNRLDWDRLYFTATVQSMQQQDYISQLDPTRKLLHVVLPFYATMFLLSSISSRVPASQLCLMASVSERSSRVAF